MFRWRPCDRPGTVQAAPWFRAAHRSNARAMRHRCPWAPGTPPANSHHDSASPSCGRDRRCRRCPGGRIRGAACGTTTRPSARRIRAPSIPPIRATSNDARRRRPPDPRAVRIRLLAISRAPRPCVRSLRSVRSRRGACAGRTRAACARRRPACPGNPIAAPAPGSRTVSARGNRRSVARAPRRARQDDRPVAAAVCRSVRAGRSRRGSRASRDAPCHRGNRAGSRRVSPAPPPARRRAPAADPALSPRGHRRSRCNVECSQGTWQASALRGDRGVAHPALPYGDLAIAEKNTCKFINLHECLDDQSALMPASRLVAGYTTRLRTWDRATSKPCRRSFFQPRRSQRLDATPRPSCAIGAIPMLFETIATTGHEQVVFCQSKDAGLKAIIAIHNTVLGPALGGLRMWPYKTDEEALNDVLRLSRGMTYKNAVAGLNRGGGKTVSIGDPAKDKSEALFRALGRFINSLHGRYITAEDVGIDVNDMEYVYRETEFVTGVHQVHGGSGDPS